MERRRLKNIVILILCLFNAFLLLALSGRSREERTARQAQAQALSALFAADGMALDPGLIPRTAPPQRCILIRSTQAEQQAAELLLGQAAALTVQGGGICTYAAGGLSAVFRDSGSFDVPVLPEGTPSALSETFCRTFSYETPVFILDAEGSGTATARRLVKGRPVLGGSVTFTVTRYALTAVSGTFVPQSWDEVRQDTPPLSALAALTAFQQMRHESSSVVSTVTGIDLCYELQSTPAAPMSLSPAWRIETDTVTYYVNCNSGAVRRG